MALLGNAQLTVFVVLAIFNRGFGAPSRQLRLTNINVTDAVFDNDILFESSARSRLDCAQQCAVYAPSCVTFTFSKRSPLGSCRGHTSLMSSKVNTRTEAMGSDTFALAEEISAGCGPPPSVTLATHLTSGQEGVGDTVTYECRGKGVLMDGPPDVTCQSNHTWTTPTFSCIDCRANNISISGNNGTLTSPGYPGVYATSMDCVYIVTLDQPGPQTVTVSMQYNLENIRDYCNDYIILNNDGQKLCGSGSANKTLRVPGQSWELLLHTDSAETLREGFILRYQTESSG